jgi:hypothetical protein
MQMYRIKSLYGNKMNLALVSDKFHTASKIATQAMSTGMFKSGTVETALKISDSMNRVSEAIGRSGAMMGKHLPHRKIICGCKPG